MINLLGAQLVSLPQGLKPATAGQLPWPNGSILSARMTPGDTPGQAMLMLAGYRFQTKVPANTQMGNVWLQLVNREMPAQFRLLSDFKAASVLADMLAGKMKPQEQSGEPNRAGRSLQESNWQKLEQGQMPFHAEPGVDERRTMLRDREDGSTRGVINASSDENHFLLHGRADLDQLGPVAFALEGEDGKPWSLKLYAGRDANIAELRPAFIKWLQEQRECDTSSPRSYIEGKILGGLPERFESLENLRV